jgi:type VI secretion system protein ImpF
MSGRGNRDSARSSALVAQLSLLDRLIDEDPDKLRDPLLSPAESTAALQRSLRRDLEALLNTRRRWRSWPECYSELGVSPVGYGISDFSAGAFNDPLRREWLRADVEHTIRRFEPRLTRLRVTLVEPEARLKARFTSASKRCCASSPRPSRLSSIRLLMRLLQR